MNILSLNTLKEEKLINTFIEFNNNSKFLFLNKDENNREIYFYKLIDCICTGISLYYPNSLLYSQDKLFLPIKEKTLSLNRESQYDNNDFIFEKNKINNVYADPLFFFNYNTSNYYHFLYDTLPYLNSYIYLKKIISNLKLLINFPEQKTEFFNFVIEFMDLLNIKKTDFIIINDFTTYKTIYISTSYTHDFDSNLPPRKEIFDIYNLLCQKANIKNNNIILHKKIYISRRTWIHNNLSNIGTNYTTRRKIMNEDILVNILKKNGYEEIFSENLSTIDKIIIFNNATNIIGAIGGGIANVVFSNKNCKLIALVSPCFLEINSRFMYLFKHLNTIYFKQCYHFEKTFFKKYMRVKYKNIIGEIINVNNNKITIQYTDTFITGFNNDSLYKNIEVSYNEVQKLDNGLNSSFYIDINKFLCELL
jgi:hypothetical protein